MGWKHYLIDPLRWLDALVADHVGPVRVLFVVSNGIGLAHQLPIIRALAAQSDVRVGVAVDRRAPIDQASVAQHLVGARLEFVSPRQAVWRKWHYVFFTDMMRMHFRRWATLFLLRHGPCWGNFDRAQTYGDGVKFDEYGDFILFKHQAALSQATSHGALAAFYRRNPSLEDSLRHRTAVFGVPKLDHYRPLGLEARRAGIAALGLDPARPTLVLTSHWSSKGVLPALGAQLIDNLASDPARLNLIILGHELIWRRAREGRDARAAHLRQRIEALSAAGSRIHFNPEWTGDNAEMLGLGDVFVCDKSSIFVECLLFDRPILFFRNPDFHFKDEGVRTAYMAASHPFSDVAELNNALAAALGAPSRLGKRRRQALDFLLSYHGQATDRLVTLIARLGRVSGQHSLRWRRACGVVDAFNSREGLERPTSMMDGHHPHDRRRSALAGRKDVTV